MLSQLENNRDYYTEPMRVWCLSDSSFFNEPFYRAYSKDDNRNIYLECVDEKSTNKLIKRFRRNKESKRGSDLIPDVVLIDVTPGSGMNKRFDTLIAFIEHAPDDFNVGVMSNEAPDGLIFDSFRCGSQCFIDSSKADMDYIFSVANAISGGNCVFPGETDLMTRNVIRGIFSENLLRLCNDGLKILHLSVAGFTKDGICHVLGIEPDEYEELIEVTGEYAGGTDINSLVACALKNGMLTDTSQASNGPTH